MSFRPEPEYEVWAAEVGVVQIERANAVPDDEYLDGAPDLVVEVVSPSNTADELEEKRLICLANGRLSFWVVYPERKSIKVSTGNESRDYQLADSIICEPLQLEMAVHEVFHTS